MGKCITGCRQVRHVQSGAKVWWDGRNVVTRMEPCTAFTTPSSPLRRYLASLDNGKTTAEKETDLRAQLIRDGVPMQRANLMCMEDFDDIMADIMADTME